MLQGIQFQLLKGIHIYSGWWFQTFFIFHNIWDNPSNWLLFFRWIETTNQFFFVSSSDLTTCIDQHRASLSSFSPLRNIRIGDWNVDTQPKLPFFFCFGGEHRIIPSPHIKQPPETMGLANYSRLQVLSLSPRRQRASAALGWQLERNGKKEGVLGWILQQFRSFFMIFQWLWGFGTKGFTICPWCVCFGRDFVPPVARRAREQSGKGGKMPREFGAAMSRVYKVET